MKERLRPLVKTLYAKTPLKPYVEKWKKEIETFDKKINCTDQKTEDVAMYRKQIQLLLEKADLILKGIESGSKTIIIESAQQIDKKAKEEAEYKIIGPVTRQFTEIYLQMLKEFVKIEYSFAETWGVNHYASSHHFQNIKERVIDAEGKIRSLEAQRKIYDDAQKQTTPLALQKK